VNHQFVLRRIDVGATAVIALEKQSVRSDNAGLILQWGKTNRGFRRGGQPGHVPPDYVFDEFRRLTVRLVDHAGTEHLRPRRIGRRRSLLCTQAVAGDTPALKAAPI
jgi:hypothetical protein